MKEKEILGMLFQAGAYYEAPSNEAPLVGYAATDDKGRQLVGDVYFNMSQAEQDADCFHFLCEGLRDKIEKFFPGPTDEFCICALPEGARSYGAVLAYMRWMRMIYPETVVLELPSEKSRGKKDLQWKRHSPRKCEKVILLEDVCNKFSTTEQTIKMVEDVGARVVAIACLLNRSDLFDRYYGNIPVISVVQKAFPSYNQDDPYVAERVRAGNVVWKPKYEWDKLAEWMK